jgi:hypothetical protein
MRVAITTLMRKRRYRELKGKKGNLSEKNNCKTGKHPSSYGMTAEKIGG